MNLFVLEYFDRYLAIDPVNIEIFHDKSNAFLRMGNYNGSEIYIDKILINPNDQIALDTKLIIEQKQQNKGSVYLTIRL